ncbi:ISPsy25, transposase [Pseudomonas savastanoi]|uniref:ISPsy25, transposase n=1 Tax=Pseudomonas savastanoi TaxID=29438 RepID=A0A3M5GJD9_PSESS|nr:ISPsy25, transposase [Pseudomonas savastanoi]
MWGGRHGTVTLFAALDYLQGKLISSIERQHRHQGWLAFLKKVNRETPKHLQRHLIVDNYATHKHAAVKAWLAKHPRFHIHFTTTSSSWMNMVERFFRDITVYLRDGSFGSVGELEAPSQRSWRYAMLSRAGTFGTQRGRRF